MGPGSRVLEGAWRGPNQSIGMTTEDCLTACVLAALVGARRGHPQSGIILSAGAGNRLTYHRIHGIRPLKFYSVGHDLDTIQPSNDRRSPAPGREVLTMRAYFRVGVIAALACLLSLSATAAEKPFQRDELADAAIKLEAQIKQDAGTVTKPAATLRREADAAFDKRDYRAGMQILSQVIAA